MKRNNENMLIRAEKGSDKIAVRSLYLAAFETSAEANLVDALREINQTGISLVAEKYHHVIGHIMFSPVRLIGFQNVKIMGLAPMAVAPQFQRQGIGSMLVHTGLDCCKRDNTGAVVVLGHPGYYPRFGFLPSSCYGIISEYDVPDEVFMVLELKPGYFQGKSGMIKYLSVFNNL